MELPLQLKYLSTWVELNMPLRWAPGFAFAILLLFATAFHKHMATFIGQRLVNTNATLETFMT